MPSGQHLTHSATSDGPMPKRRYHLHPLLLERNCRSWTNISGNTANWPNYPSSWCRFVPIICRWALRLGFMGRSDSVAVELLKSKCLCEIIGFILPSNRIQASSASQASGRHCGKWFELIDSAWAMSILSMLWTVANLLITKLMANSINITVDYAAASADQWNSTWPLIQLHPNRPICVSESLEWKY